MAMVVPCGSPASSTRCMAPPAISMIVPASSSGARVSSARVVAPMGGYRGGVGPRVAGPGARAGRPAFYSRRVRAYGRLRGGGYGYGYPVAGGFVVPYELGYPDTVGYDAGPAVNAEPQNYVDVQPDPGAMQGYGAPEAPQVADAAPQRVAAIPPAPEDAVTIIYKDGRSEQIHNYALTRTTLYVTDKRRREIPLEQVDVAATEKVNHDAGVEFQVPEAH